MNGLKDGQEGRPLSQSDTKQALNSDEEQIDDSEVDEPSGDDDDECVNLG